MPRSDSVVIVLAVAQPTITTISIQVEAFNERPENCEPESPGLHAHQ